MAVSPLLCGPGNMNGFVLDGKSYRQGWATAQMPNKPALSGLTITTSISCACSLTTTTCGRWNLVTNWSEETRHSSWPIELLVLRLNKDNRNCLLADRADYSLTLSSQIWSNLTFDQLLVQLVQCNPGVRTCSRALETAAITSKKTLLVNLGYPKTHPIHSELWVFHWFMGWSPGLVYKNSMVGYADLED